MEHTELEAGGVVENSVGNVVAATEELMLLNPIDDDKMPNSKSLTDAAMPKVHKRRIYWKALDASKVSANSLWASGADDASDILINEEEFNKLFVDSGDSVEKEVDLINANRAQNAANALARIPYKFEDIRVRIKTMDYEGLTMDQLKSLEEFLPTDEESSQLKAYDGDISLLNEAERYMLVMLGFEDAPQRIRCMVYKQQFKTRVLDCRAKFSTIENACEEVVSSSRLRKVLKTILKVGNQLNDDGEEEHKGFTLDSLLKLQSAKAFDKKTSILQYVIKLIFRADPDCLRFNEDLQHIAEASSFTFESVSGEKDALKDECDVTCKFVMKIAEEDDSEDNVGSMIDFLQKADEQCQNLQKRFENAHEKFSGILTYFGEDSAMTSIDFFSTLDKFVTEFVATRENVKQLL